MYKYILFRPIYVQNAGHLCTIIIYFTYVTFYVLANITKENKELVIM